jgi:hypothetical protein
MPEKNPIVRCAIHPAVGVARVGNAPADEYYPAPEIPGQAADPGPQGFKNAKGEVRKEACRFRVYGYDARGKVVREITAADADVAEITWEVHLANRKAAWYKFANAMDLKQYALPTTFRNGTVAGSLRQALVIDPGAIEISGRRTKGPHYRFDQGFIRFGEGGPIQVPLGELRTDEKGRLLVLGGAGHSASATNQPAVTFANNEGWYDDVADGPVRATVRFKGAGGETMIAEPAMVAVTPPNFGPGLHGVVTLWDVIYDLYRRQGWLEAPPEVRFWSDIYPIFERMVQSQWVNLGAYLLFGPGSPGDLLAPDILKKLADPSPAARPERERVFRMFRQPPPPWDAPGKRTHLPPPQPALLPPFYGDGFGEYNDIAIDELALTQTQYERLECWAKGDFQTGRPPRSKGLEELSPEEQVRALDRAPLEDCLGGPFHPGIELTWPMRVPSMWRPPADAAGLLFRLNILSPEETPRDDFGPVLTPDACLGLDGPLTASGPGTLTRWLGIPWQTDEASCLAGYDFSTYLPLPSFWAARVPNDVLSQQAFEQATERGLSYVQRLKNLAHRQFWLRDLQGSGYQARINNMVKEWSLLGIVAEHPAPKGKAEAGFPGRYWVETDRDRSFSDADPTWKQLLMVEGAEPKTELLKQAAKPILELAAEREERPSEVVHPRRRRLRQDER